ncbi:hypothetical protein FA95DRAFT_1564183 [Auriscalpium vulgare]|uniref:Uncharacterized protein n=1 Tax=Auriscalpium vulgare TaxID=40419 RepID=A0ACB8REQ2_9AGAM|nr:hypothetical protein FA95DRAFT_1564183 [Auriscalpium vulgare]
MAAVVSPAPVHAHSRHFLPNAHSNAHFSAFHSQNKHGHNPFEAFAPRHHSSAAQTTPSWRSHDRLQVPAAFRASGSRSHSRASSEDSTGSWRARSRSPVVVPVEHTAAVSNVTASSRRMYSVEDLLALSASPLVGVDAGAQAALDDFVAHHVWRRGPSASSSSRSRPRRGQGRSPSKSQESTTDGDSEGSD